MSSPALATLNLSLPVAAMSGMAFGVWYATGNVYAWWAGVVLGGVALLIPPGAIIWNWCGDRVLSILHPVFSSLADSMDPMPFSNEQPDAGHVVDQSVGSGLALCEAGYAHLENTRERHWVKKSWKGCPRKSSAKKNG